MHDSVDGYAPLVHIHNYRKTMVQKCHCELIYKSLHLNPSVFHLVTNLKARKASTRAQKKGNVNLSRYIIESGNIM